MTLDNLKVLLQRFRILLIFISFIAISVAFFVPKMQERKNLLEKEAQIEEKMTLLQEEIADLRNRELAVNNDDYHLEKLARNKLSYAKKDELIYHFTNQEK